MNLRSRFALAALLTFATGGCSFFGNTGFYTNPDYPPPDLGYLQISMPPIPDFPENDWINAAPSITDSLDGKVVLLDFWDYTCVNCIRTLPYLEEWYSRYRKDGLVIIGVHCPEFSFAGKRQNLVAAVKKLGIKYPVVMDDGYVLWKEFGNEAWPEEYLFDRDGILRYRHIGEGEYGNTEAMIRKLLRNGNRRLSFPPLMKPVRPTDAPGAVCYRPTPETYLGFGRGRPGNKQGYSDNEVVDYRRPGSIGKNKFYLVGKWEIRKQYIRYAGRTGEGYLLLDYAASSVNLVIRPDYHSIHLSGARKAFRVYVYLDSLPVPGDERPSGMLADKAGDTYITVTDPGMYDIIGGKKYGMHVLTVAPGSDAFAAYSFTFGTSCVTAPASAPGD